MDTADEQPKPVKQVSSRPKKTLLLWMLVVLIVLLLGAIGYLGMQLKTSADRAAALKKDNQQLQSKLDALSVKDDTSKKTAVGDIACADTPTVAMKDNIKDALDSKNTAAFSTYFSDPVTFVIAASEKGGSESAIQAATDMNYANTATGPWDFSLPAATIADYDAGFYTDYFDANTYVGRAASGQVAAFDFNCAGKINQAFLAADEDLL